MNSGVIPISLALVCAACRPDMNNQPKAKPLSQSDFFADESSARQPPAHTVAYGAAQTNPAFDTGLINGTYITQLPLKLTPALLNQGRERFDAICAECHDRSGSGNGMVAKRAAQIPGAGALAPTNLHQDRLRHIPDGQLFGTITNGILQPRRHLAQAMPGLSSVCTTSGGAPARSPERSYGFHRRTGDEAAR